MKFIFLFFIFFIPGKGDTPQQNKFSDVWKMGIKGPIRSVTINRYMPDESGRVRKILLSSNTRHFSTDGLLAVEDIDTYRYKQSGDTLTSVCRHYTKAGPMKDSTVYYFTNNGCIQETIYGLYELITTTNLYCYDAEKTLHHISSGTKVSKVLAQDTASKYLPLRKKPQLLFSPDRYGNPRKAILIDTSSADGELSVDSITYIYKYTYYK